MVVWADFGDEIDIIDCLSVFDHYYYAALIKQLKLILTLIYLLTLFSHHMNFLIVGGSIKQGKTAMVEFLLGKTH